MHLTIGQLAKKVQLNPKTIRYYEEVGLMPRARRSENGYRMYTWEEENRLRFIKRAKLLGLSLQEAKQVVQYTTEGQCSLLEKHLLELLEAKLAGIEGLITELRLLKKELHGLCESLNVRVGADKDRDADAPCSCLDKPQGDPASNISMAYPRARDRES